MSQTRPPLATERAQLIAQLRQGQTYDIAIVGGGATGLGIALDAAARGFSVALFEANDFAKGTSSRSTKLVHGGVRYLAQGDIPLVREALHERSTILHNAPHLAGPLPLVMPCHKPWEIPFYWTGLKLYDALSGRHGLGSTELVSVSQTQALLPNVLATGLYGGVKYWDGQFDDARLALALARTAAQRGAQLLNHCRVSAIDHQNGWACGIQVVDNESGLSWSVKTRCLVNATGVWVDQVRQIDDHASQRSTQTMVAPSQGVHVVVDRDFMPGNHALIIPKTSDGRVLFAVPWLGKVILGTTDTPRERIDAEPRPLKAELDFILRESAAHLRRAPGHQDIRSIWVGLRPLVKPPDAQGKATKALSREHTIVSSASGMVTVTGGKWTTYRVMAEDTLAHCFDEGLLTARAGGLTRDLLLVGAQSGGPITRQMTETPGLAAYGDEQPFVQSMAGANHWLTTGLSEAMVRFAARHEYARTVEDVLARRSRLLMLDARLAESLADEVGRLLRDEIAIDPRVADFKALAQRYQQLPTD